MACSCALYGRVILQPLNKTRTFVRSMTWFTCSIVHSHPLDRKVSLHPLDDLMNLHPLNRTGMLFGLGVVGNTHQTKWSSPVFEDSWIVSLANLGKRRF